MRSSIVLLSILLLPMKMGCQTLRADTLSDSSIFKSAEQIVQNSRKITNETFDLKFLLRALPDNGWFLKLKKDATFEYIHWSGWGESEGTILETGTYSILNNLVLIRSTSGNSELENREFYLVTSPTDSIDNNATIDCVREKESIYCLCHK